MKNSYFVYASYKKNGVSVDSDGVVFTDQKIINSGGIESLKKVFREEYMEQHGEPSDSVVIKNLVLLHESA